MSAASLRDYKPLRAMASDAEDLRYVSAYLQDAALKIGDIAYDKARRRFAFVANRFVWECAADRAAGPFARVRAGAHFDDVAAVQYKNLRADAPNAVVSILSMTFEPGADGAGRIVIALAGGGAIGVDVESVNGHVRDLSEPWRTRSRPDHEGEESR